MKQFRCRLAWRIVLVASSAQHVKKPFSLLRNPVWHYNYVAIVNAVPIAFWTSSNLLDSLHGRFNEILSRPYNRWCEHYDREASWVVFKIWSFVSRWRGVNISTAEWIFVNYAVDIYDFALNLFRKLLKKKVCPILREKTVSFRW